MLRIGTLVLFLVTSCVPAQDLVISNARILDGTGGVIEQGSIVVSDGRIVSVSAGDPEAQGVLEIDAQGMTVMPGLIDTHRHLLTGSGATNEEELDDWIQDRLPSTLQDLVAAGFTTVMSNGDSYPAILEVRQGLDDGQLKGPRLLVVGPVFTAPGGHPAGTICTSRARGFVSPESQSWCRAHLTVEAEAAEAARAKVRELANAGVDAIKAVYEPARGGRPKLDDDVYAAIADEARQLDLPFMVHTRSQLALKAVELGASRMVHIRGWGSGVNEILAEAGIPVSTTVWRTNYSPQRRSEVDNAGPLWDAGVVVAFGTDRRGVPPAENLLLEARALARTLSNEQVIASLTRSAAAYLDLSEEIGTLEPGKVADIVIIDGDPLTDLSDLECRSRHQGR